MNWKNLIDDLKKDMIEFPAIAQYLKDMLMKHLSLSNKKDLDLLKELREIHPPDIVDQIMEDPNEDIKVFQEEIQRLKRREVYEQLP